MVWLINIKVAKYQVGVTNNMKKLIIIISSLFLYVGFSQNISFYGAFESSGVYLSQQESKDFEK